MNTNERGQAALEAVGSVSVLALFVFAMLTVCYLLFARGWIQYQSEQALYCLAESRPAWGCRSELEKNLQLLPWGRTRGMTAFALNGVWTVQFEWTLFEPQIERNRWTWPNYVVRVQKHLSTKMIVRNNKDLRS